MSMMKKEQLELAIWKKIAGFNMSVSHDHWHLDRVLAFALELNKHYGGDIEVLIAAILMHDLGRADKERPHGEMSRQASVEQAAKILRAIHFPESKQESVLTAILEHDQHDVTPSTIEGRILKDADFLAGFGAWGILRIALWSGESGRNIDTLLSRLTDRMPKRLENVEFPESMNYGHREMLFAHLFLQELRREVTLPRQMRRGLYIVLEGISGSGKGTQAKILEDKLEQLALPVEVVKEPDDNYRAYRDAWQDKHGDLNNPTIMKYLLMADRYQLMKEKVEPALEADKVVISDRCFISTLVYQGGGDDYEMAVTAFDHRFTLLPDLLILFDVEPEVAWRRIENRRQSRGIYEEPHLLKAHHDLYLKVCRQLFPKQLVIVDANMTVGEIADVCWSHVSKNSWFGDKRDRS